MPSAINSSQFSSGKKTQQSSISSFFGKPASSNNASKKIVNGGIAERKEDGSSNGIAKARSPTGETTHVEQDNDDEDDVRTSARSRPSQGTDLPARKRLRLSDSDDQTTSITPVSTNDVRRQSSKYAFSSSANGEEEYNPSDEESKAKREKLHQKFVQKLGRPDSIAEIKRRNWLISEETQQEELEDGDAAEDERPAKKGAKATKAASKLTPMEKQYLDIKRVHLDTILVVEVGYKFKFFGEDARIAAKELSIVCIPGKMRYDEHPSEAHYDRFASASIPVHRLHVHVKRLVEAGRKVGVVRQLETAALKAAGDNRNAPFVRKLTNLYTKGTYIDEADDAEAPRSTATGYLVCITEENAKGWGTDEKAHVGMVAVQPATGDVIYDDFEDGFMRSEVETRLLHIAPSEILIVGKLSRASSKIVSNLSMSKSNVFGDKVRVEEVDKAKTAAAMSYSQVADFYANKVKASGASSQDEAASKTLDKVLHLSESVTICLSAMIKHLSEYGLEHVFDLTKYFQSFSARSHMLLNATTLTSLEIYRNQTDHSVKGSLFWTLDRTKTKFGQRLLRKWVGRPLLIRGDLERRMEAVEELKNGQHGAQVDRISRLLSQIRTDLEKSLIRIYYGKCLRPELLIVLQTLQKIGNEFADVRSADQAGFSTQTLNEAVVALPSISGDVISYLDRINTKAAQENDKYAFFRDECEDEDITDHKLGIASVEHELNEHRSEAAEKVRRKKVEYVTVAGIEYLIEIDNSQLKHVPASWAKISGTKKLSRFHTPETVRLIRQRDQHKEALAAACDKAFARLLEDISTKYQKFRDCVQALATLDALLSLATVANQPGYVKPEFTDEICIDVQQGRHPMVEQLLLDNFVPNDIQLAADATRGLLITGPNMGGKSSYVRQVALIAIMGQIGSYVPADSARLGMLDAVFTRMGAFDNMMAGESTFMVELSETSDILKQASPRSLVILDELGRGTSTHDGVAIAQAVLDYIVREKKCLMLFITHYQNLSHLSRRFDNDQLKNVHVRFSESQADDGSNEITFLYEVGEGVAHRSYGLNVAKLANIPPSVVDSAAIRSKEMEDQSRVKSLKYISRSLGDFFGEIANAMEDTVALIEEL